MLEQTFAFSDIPLIFTLAFLEILLSADNAVVLGALTRPLPVPLRRKALYIGIITSFILRAAALILVATLLKSSWFQALGGLYLFYLCIRYLTRPKNPRTIQPVYSFWKIVLFIELIDLIFAIDSIVAGVAFINHDFSKLWIVYLGGMIGIVGMRYAASLFSRFMDYFPKLERSAYLMIGWIGIQLGLSPFHLSIPSPIFWSVIALFFLSAFFPPSQKRE
jgi:YkoY family integral membrane protein